MQGCRITLVRVWRCCLVALAGCAILLSGGAESLAGETLYNGIALPEHWPPEVQTFTHDPMPVPYLDDPPAVIPIDVGRQLFVDDFLIANTNCTRTFHKATWHPSSPLLEPDKPWETPPAGEKGVASAIPYSDGVWYDPTDDLYKMWYLAAWGRYTCYAQSQDGIHWEKPELDVMPGTNIVMDHTRTDIELDFTNGRDSGTVWLDHNAATPAERFKMMVRDQGAGDHEIFVSPDGIHWGERVVATGAAQDRSTLFYNPFRGVWGLSLRSTFFRDPGRDLWHYELTPPGGFENPGPWKAVRIRRYAEGKDIMTAANSWPRLGKPKWWKFAQGREMAKVPSVWVGADRLDIPLPNSNIEPQLYNLDVVAYESVMVGLFAILQINKTPERPYEKINNLCTGFSRDGFHWDRPSREPILAVSDDLSAWNAANLQSVGGCFLVHDEQLHIYASGRGGFTEESPRRLRTGLATLRRDGFASMDAGKEGGSLMTRPVRFSGSHLFVNLDAPGGKLQVELLRSDGQVITPFTRENCVVLTGDDRRLAVRWNQQDATEVNLSTLAGNPVRFRFYLENGSLYSFWVAPDRAGASRGFVAAGGPRFSGPSDDVGKAGE